MDNNDSIHNPDNFDPEQRSAYLIHSCVKHSLSQKEQEELNNWINQSDNNRKLFEELTSESALAKDFEIFSNIEPEVVLARFKSNLSFATPRKTFSAWPYLAAACVAGIIGLAYYFKPAHKQEAPVVITTISPDITAGTATATLRLEGGTTIILNPFTQDTLINAVTKIKNGELEYHEAASTAMTYHTISVPRKGFYKLKLPDGTACYLNAESSVRYPISFNGSERRVTVTGEAYFDVVHEENKPFIVEAGTLEIRDIGTAFNVNSYTNEPNNTATLIEGIIEVRQLNLKTSYRQLVPGEQAVINGRKISIKRVDNSDEVISWKDNRFRFINTPLTSIMRQVERWYGAEVIYMDSVNVHFNGTIDRNVPVSKLLYLLEKTNDVHFKIEGNTITVSK